MPLLSNLQGEHKATHSQLHKDKSLLLSRLHNPVHQDSNLNDHTLKINPLDLHKKLLGNRLLVRGSLKYRNNSIDSNRKNNNYTLLNLILQFRSKSSKFQPQNKLNMSKE